MAEDSGFGLKLIVGGSIGALVLLFLGRKQVGAAAAAVEEGVLAMADKVKAVDADGVSQGYRPLVTDITSPAIWDAVVGPVKNDSDSRSVFAYDAVIDQFDVVNNPRYQPRIIEGGTARATFCNVFVQDVMRAMGYELPWANANELSRWLAEGRSEDWSEVDMKTAQARANDGYPTIVAWENPGGIGHVAVVRAGNVDLKQGPTTAQAGAVLFSKKYAASGFGSARVPYLRYYTAA